MTNINVVLHILWNFFSALTVIWSVTIFFFLCDCFLSFFFIFNFWGLQIFVFAACCFADNFSFLYLKKFNWQINQNFRIRFQARTELLEQHIKFKSKEENGTKEYLLFSKSLVRIQLMNTVPAIMWKIACLENIIWAVEGAHHCRCFFFFFFNLYILAFLRKT